MSIVDVIKENIENSREKGPLHKRGKKVLLEMCDQLGIKTIEQFFDALILSQRLRCSKNFWEHEYSLCLDDEGTHVAYGKYEIAKALEKDENDLTCHDICEVCDSCAHINQISAKLIYYLADLMDDRGLTINEEILNS